MDTTTVKTDLFMANTLSIAAELEALRRDPRAYVQLMAWATDTMPSPPERQAAKRDRQPVDPDILTLAAELETLRQQPQMIGRLVAMLAMLRAHPDGEAAS